MILIDWSIDLFVRISRRLRSAQPDYREFLFQDLIKRLDSTRPKRILEIGPRDGEDTLRLLTLNPDRLVLVDLPDKKDRVNGWLQKLNTPNVDLVIGNIMYDDQWESIEPFDVVWCTGVLYHNPEQLRMVRRLFELTKLGGILVIESATARRRATRDENCVEIWHGIDKSVHRKYHVSKNISHLPSKSAIRSWLEMVGFKNVYSSSCHRQVLRRLEKTRGAFIAERPQEDQGSAYYNLVGLNYPIGKAR
jgi:SAM-dependent methyltransferase